MDAAQWFLFMPGETLGAGLLAKILRDAGLTRDEFERLL